jgi:hypothetical protein
MSTRNLHPLDETLMHQIPWPFRFAGTSDLRFYDRHWLAGVDPAGSGGFLSGIAFYKNLFVCDGYGVVQRGDRQSNARFSRPLRDDPVDAAVGDISVEVVQPFRRVRLAWSGKTTPLAAELEYWQSFDPYCEEHYIDASTGRVGQEITRYNQIGRWNGWLDDGGGRIEVRDWWGVRDHSWGYRPGVGGMDRSVADPAGNDGSSASAMLHFVLYCATEDTSVCVSMREDAVGRRTYLDGEVIHVDGTHDVVTEVELRPHFHPGARTYDIVEARIGSREGRVFAIRATPLLHPWAYSGTGYDGGYLDGRGLGVPRGHLVEHDVYELIAPEEVRLDGRPTPPGHREQFARVEIDGTATTGYCTVMTRGELPRYGLE